MDNRGHFTGVIVESRNLILPGNSKFGVLLALVLSASMWFYVDRVLIPFQITDATAHDTPRGNLSDLYPRWLGARELLLHHSDPYSPEVTREIQVGYYGRVLDPSHPGDPHDQQGFAYPVYVVFLLAPTIHLPFHVVQRAFNDLLWLITAFSVLLWLHALHWRPPNTWTAIFILLLLGSVPAVQGIKLQQLSLLVAVLLAGSAAALSSGYLVLAGFLLALSTIKPQLAGLPVAWLTLWALHDGRRRQRLLWAFGSTMLLLLIGAQVVLPGWIGRFRTAISDYHQYTHNVSLLAQITTPLIGDALAVAFGTVFSLDLLAFFSRNQRLAKFRHRAQPGFGLDRRNRSHVCALQSGTPAAGGFTSCQTREN